MKSLHIGNIANMAFSYVDILREYKQEDDVLCYDLDHNLSCPSFALTKEKNPSWFKKIKTVDFLPKLPPLEETYKDWLIALARDSKKFGDKSFSYEEVTSYSYYEQIISKNFFDKKYDIIFGYAYAAIPMMIHSEIPYVPVEIGTLRHLETKDDVFSRLISYTYRNAPHIIITNPDTLISAKALNLNSYTFIPHPVNEKIWYKNENKNNKFAYLKNEIDILFVAPARHDWELKGNDKYIQAFSRVLDTGVKAKLILMKWGEDLDKSYELIDKVGVKDHIVWLNPLPEKELIDLYSISDVLLDQFGSSKTFGLITPKAMSCSLPVITRYQESLHTECYEIHPPLCKAESENEIFEWLLYFSKNKNKILDIGKDSREWIEKNHSKEIIAQKFSDVKKFVCDKQQEFAAFSSLKQKKLEIVYEAQYAPIYDSKYHDPIPYCLMDEYLAKIVRDHVNIEKKEKLRLLDLGCGPGSMVGWIIKAIPGIEIHGIDISPSMIQIAREKYPNVSFQVGDAENIPFDASYFDVVLCSGMLHHFPDINPILLEIKRVLKKDGVFIAREPNSKNFANNVSVVSFVHICLRHIIFQLLEKQALAEPEEHDFHRDFDYYGFPEELSNHFRVKNLYFGQSISYFYDMLNDPSCAKYLKALERTLSEFPGLNMITVCQKQENCGIATNVREAQKHYDVMLEKPDAMLINLHIRTILSFYDWIHDFKKDKKIISKIINFFKKKPIKKYIHMKLNENMLSYECAHDKGTFSNIKEEKKFITNNLFLFDFVSLTISGKINSTSLIDLLNFSKDYTPVEINIGHDLLITLDAEEHKSYFSHFYQMPKKNIYSRKGLIFSRFLLNKNNFMDSLSAVDNIFKLDPDIKNRIFNKKDLLKKVDFFNKNMLNVMVDKYK